VFSVLILEDDVVASNLYKRMIHKIDDEIKVTRFKKEEDAYKFAVNGQIDLFLIDIHLPQSHSGYVFAERIRAIKRYELTSMIFITSVAEKKFIAYENIHCYEYLIKPINEKAFTKTLLKTLNRKIVNTDDQAYIVLYRHNVACVIRHANIKYIDLEKKVISIFAPDNQASTFSADKYSLGTLEEKLGNGFIRIQKSTIVNKAYVKSVNYTQEFVQLENTDKPIKIGRLYIEQVKKVFD